MGIKTSYGLVAASVVAMAVVLGGDGNANERAAGKPVIVHLSRFTNDLHAASMALKLAGVMQKNGADVTLFVDLEGVRLVDDKQPLDLLWGHGKPVNVLYDDFVKAGGQVLVCPHCAHAAGVSTEQLRSGAKLADESRMGELLMSAEKILDY